MQFDNSSRHCFMMLPMLLPCSSDTAAAEVAPKVEDATAALEAGADAPKPAAEELAATSAPPEALGAGVPNRDGVAAAGWNLRLTLPQTEKPRRLHRTRTSYYWLPHLQLAARWALQQTCCWRMHQKALQLLD